MQPLRGISHDPTIAHSFYHRRVLRYRRDHAERLAARGYNLILAARREDRLQALADQLQARYAIRQASSKPILAKSTGLPP